MYTDIPVLRPRLAVAVAVAAVGMCAEPPASAQTAPAPKMMTWTIDGDMREAIVYAPSVPTARGRVPLVLSFHGRGDDMRNFRHTDLHAAWPDAVVVYFDGMTTRGGLSGWQVERGENRDRDLKLVDAALATLRQTFTVDGDRVYATGFSNGAMFTYLLWAERPDVFAAYAPVAGRLRPSVQPAQPRPLFHVAGELDRQVTIADQRAAIAIAIDVNGVRDTATPCGDGCTTYGAGTRAPVMTWIHPGGHDYPRSTAQRIASFFQKHSRTP